MALLFKYWSVLFWISLAMISGLFLFINGFFLRKNVVPLRSNCSMSQVDSFNFKNPLHSAAECLKPRGRIILLIVDALKYEFVTEFEDADAAGTYHRNKLPIIHKTLKKYPKNTKLFKFVADPPTTTMQRLKAITTGTLPTFIDIHQNFAAEDIQEDNFIDQNKENGNIVMGDDTWSKLYPKKFLRDHTVYSFDVADLDSVDRSVRKWIFNEIKNKDWSLMVAHILGIDHCGHTYGMNHPHMLRKLNDTNFLIKDLIEKINRDKEDTILFVVGDHGMIESGDHGGESADEMDAAMFVYSTMPLITASTNFDIEKKSTVRQVGIVPTISVILGIPIPFTNIGNVIVDALPTNEAIQNFNFILHSLWRNIFQVQRYLDTYSIENSFSDKSKLQEIKQIYDKLLNKIEFVKNNRDLKDFVNTTDEYFTTVRKVCYDEWVKFDYTLMARGVLVIFCAMFFLFMVISGLIGQRMQTVLESSFLTYVFVVAVTSLLLSSVLYCLQLITDLENSSLFCCGLSLIICFVILLIKNWDCVSDSWYEQSKRKKSIINFLSRFIFITSAFGVFSNSYILEENKISSYFLVTLFCFFIHISRSKNILESIDKKGKVLGNSNRKILVSMSLILVFITCLLIRCSNFYWRYRPEFIDRMKGSEVNSTYYVIGKTGSIISQEVEMNFVIIAVVSLAVYISVMKVWLKRCGNLSGYSPGAFLTKFFTVIIGISISCYWFLKLQKSAKFNSRMRHVNFLPILVYILISSAVYVIFYWPLSVFLLPKESKNINIKKEDATVPKLYEKIKNILYVKRSDDKNEIPVVYGLGTVYSACFILLSIFLCLLYILVLGFVIAPSIILMNLVCIVLLYLSAVHRVSNDSSLEGIAHVPNLAILCWFFIAEYFFFATGHQASFSSIHWDAGFIGIEGSLSVMTIRAILIIINTFGSHIILGMMIPLLVITPFTLRFVFPNLTKSSRIQLEDIKRGELLLFHNSTIFHSEVFCVCGKYILFHACKVLACMLAVTVHSRHLMVWGIFAPKLIFEGISFLITVGSVLTSLLLLLRIEKCIEKFISQIA